MIDCLFTCVNYSHCRCLLSISLHFDLYQILERMRLLIPGKANVSVFQ